MRLGLSLAAIGKLLGMSRATMSRWSHGLNVDNPIMILLSLAAIYQYAGHQADFDRAYGRAIAMVERGSNGVAV